MTVPPEPPALDGGWGYVVAFASFMVAFLQDGVRNSYGITVPYLQVSYPGASMSIIMLAPGLFPGCFLATGPLTAILVRKFGCRPVAFSGGIVTTLSLSVATRAETIEVFILFYGVFTGIGIGLIYLPSITMVNTYFSKKRGVVVGMVTSGSGVGLLVMAIVIDRLMAEYGWRGCYLIIAGVYLHLCVCACLMRPLEDNYKSRYGDASESNEKDVTEDFLQINNGKESHSEKMNGSSCVDDSRYFSTKYGKDVIGPEKTGGNFGSAISNMSQTSDDTDMIDVNEKGRKPKWHRLPMANVHRAAHISNDSLSPSKQGDIQDIQRCEECINGPHVEMTKNGKPESLDTAVLATSPKLALGSDQKDLLILPNSHHQQLILQHLHHHSHHPHRSHGPASHHSSQYTVSDRDDVDSIAASDFFPYKSSLLNQPPEFISMSTLSINTLRSRSLRSVRSRSAYSVKFPSQHLSNGLSRVKGESLASLEEQTDPEQKSSSHSTLALLKVVRFDLFCAGAFLIQIAASVPAMFTPSYALSLGLDTRSAAEIVSFLGISNTLGRLAAGLLSNLGLGSVRVYNSGTCLAGVACYLLPLCTTYSTILAFAVCHGFFIGFFPPLQSLILVEQLGLHRLPSSFGIMCLCKSVASMVGPTLAGALYEVVGNYAVPFYFAGGILTLSNILHVIMSYCPKVPD